MFLQYHSSENYFNLYIFKCDCQCITDIFLGIISYASQQFL